MIKVEFMNGATGVFRALRGTWISDDPVTMLILREIPFAVPAAEPDPELWMAAEAIKLIPGAVVEFDPLPDIHPGPREVE